LSNKHIFGIIPSVDMWYSKSWICYSLEQSLI